MVKKLLFSCLFMAVLSFQSCKTQNSPNVDDDKISTKTVAIITFSTMAAIVMFAYVTSRKK